MKLDGACREVGKSGIEAAGGEAWVAEGLSDIWPIDTIASLGKELTLFTGTIPNLDGAYAGTILTASYGGPPLNREGKAMQPFTIGSVDTSNW